MGPSLLSMMVKLQTSRRFVSSFPTAYYLNNTFERDVPAQPGDHAPAPRPAAVPAHFGQVHLRSVYTWTLQGGVLCQEIISYILAVIWNS